MGKRTVYTPGTFCSVDLGSSDTEGSRRFYESVFGWTSKTSDVPGGKYTSFQLGGSVVAGMFDFPVPTWLTWISVDDVSATTKHALDLGAQLMEEVIDMSPVGKMSMIQDVGGATVGLWEGGSFKGAELVNDPGAFCLTQLDTKDPSAATAFYEELLGWTITEQAKEPQAYWGVFVGDAVNAGIAQHPAPPNPDYWLVYFTSAQLETSLEKIGDAGGSIILGITEIPFGRIAIARDPQGATFALFEGRTDD